MIEWLKRFWYAQHNARVLADMEWRFILAIEEATNGRMSKAYYSIEAMRSEIAAARNETYQMGYDDAKSEME